MPVKFRHRPSFWGRLVCVILKRHRRGVHFGTFKRTRAEWETSVRGHCNLMLCPRCGDLIVRRFEYIREFGPLTTVEVSHD